MRYFRILAAFVILTCAGCASLAQLPFYLAYQDTMPHTTADYLYGEAQKYLGCHYRYGGKGPDAFDCAGFTRFIYAKIGYELAPYAGGQYKQGEEIDDPRNLRRGDLVFWGGRRGGKKSIGHVGMVVDVDTATGRFRFIHSATSGGIRYDQSEEQYYRSRYIGACRVLPDPPYIEAKPAKKKNCWEK